MAEQQPKLRPMESTAYTDSERLIRAIGQLQLRMGGEWPSPSYESDELNELWVRNRVVLLRKLVEQHPGHEAALCCAAQWEGLEADHPLLFSHVEDELDTQEYVISGFYRASEWSNDDDESNWREAMRPMVAIQERRADSIIAECPRLGVAEWAHRFRINMFARSVLGGCGENPSVDSESIDRLISLIEDFVEFRKNCSSAIEPVPGYFRAGMRQCADHLMLAIDGLEPRDRRVQYAFLERARDLLPNQENVTNYLRRFNSEGKMFALSFDDLSSGKRVDIADYRGQVVVIDFWSTRCEPCVDFVKRIKSVVDAHRGSVAVIGISCDRAANAQLLEAKVRAYQKQHDIGWPILVDPGLCRRWRIRRIPTLFAIDRQGILRSTHADENFPQVVEELLSEP